MTCTVRVIHNGIGAPIPSVVRVITTIVVHPRYTLVTSLLVVSLGEGLSRGPRERVTKENYYDPNYDNGGKGDLRGRRFALEQGLRR